MPPALKRTLEVWQLIIGLIIAIGTVGAAYGATQEQIKQLTIRTDAYQKDHDLVVGMATDVKWIKERLSK